MKRFSYLSILSLFCVTFSFAQQTGVSLQGKLTSGELFDRIEQQAGVRIYVDPQLTDSLSFTLQAQQEGPAQLLQRILSPYGLTVYTFQDRIFITGEEHLQMTLPEGYFSRGDRILTTDDDLSGISLSLMRRNQKAVSENKVYEIGDPARSTEGERVTLTGTITDFKTGEPVVGVTLMVKEPFTGTTTDPYGYYTIRLPAGRHELLIQGMGMKDTRRQIYLHTEGKLDIELEEQIYALREVTVSSERIQNARSTSLGVERLKIKDIKNIPTAFGEVDILRVVMSLPGVKSVGEISSGFNVRGGATDQNLILFNEGTIYNPTHLFGMFSAFNPDVVKDMELYKSSIPSKYGGRISSVLDINSREGNKKEYKGSASIGLLTSSLVVEGPIAGERTSFIVGGRTTYSDWLLRQLPEKVGTGMETPDSTI
ncbi:MAG: TonB-dependent receptor [Tannerellaceae bacterium]|nr:TonB-dependent receptor [Tannerellaceae bacterium]